MQKLKKIASICIISGMMLGNVHISQANNSISEDEQKQVHQAILDLQTNINSSGQNMIETLMSDFKKYSNYEENGNSQISFEFNNPSFGNVSANLLIPQYNAKNSGINGQLDGKVDVSFDVKNSEFLAEDISGKMTSDFSVISHNGDTYGLMKNINTQTNSPELKDIFDSLNAAFVEQKYLKISDPQSQMIFDFLKNISVENIFNKANEIAEKPLLEAYKKEGNTYYLIPTQEACDVFFELQNTFGMYQSWYTPSSCTPQAYKTLVNKFKDIGALTLTLGTQNHKLSYNLSDTSGALEMNILYSKEHFGAFSLKASDAENDKNIFHINYIKNRNLNILLNSVEEKVNLSFKSKIKNNSFYDIESQLSIPKVMKGAFQLKNNKFAGRFQIYETGWDYNENKETYEEKLKNIYGMQISGNQSSNGNIQNMKMKMIGVENSTKKPFFTGDFSMKNKEYSFKINAQSENFSSDSFILQGNGIIDAQLFSLNGEYEVNIEEEVFQGKMFLEIDTQNDKNNIHLTFDMSDDTQKLMEILIKNQGQKTFKENILIEAPADFIEIEMPSNDYYYDETEYEFDDEYYDEYGFEDLYE